MFALQSKIVRVLNLWQKNSVFKSDIIQPLLDMAAGLPPPSVTPVSASSAVPVNSTTPGKLYTAYYTGMHPLLCGTMHCCGNRFYIQRNHLHRLESKYAGTL